MKGFRYLRNVATLGLDEEACIGCGRCVDVCPHQVVALAGRHAQIEDRDACIECGACATNCPTDAIRVDAGVGCAISLVAEWLRDRKMGRSAGRRPGRRP
jgi:NAD-dependent dihydropyrimidine dehydrogenase PreA subunit